MSVLPACAGARQAGARRVQTLDVHMGGIGHIVTGMERQGYALSLRKLVDDGWNAAFEQHRLLAPAGGANAPTPFDAVQRAAWQALNHKLMGSPGVTEGLEEDVL